MNDETTDAKKEEERLWCPLSFSSHKPMQCQEKSCALWYEPCKQCGFLSMAAMLSSLAVNTRDIHNVLASELPYMHTQGGDPIR